MSPRVWAGTRARRAGPFQRDADVTAIGVARVPSSVLRTSAVRCASGRSARSSIIRLTASLRARIMAGVQIAGVGVVVDSDFAGRELDDYLALAVDIIVPPNHPA
jgi:hypothetical protein